MSILSLVLCFLVTLGLDWSCHADEENSLKVLPPRIILGSLAFGTGVDSSVPIQLVVSGLAHGMCVINIDCSHAQGIVLVGQRSEGPNVIVNMRADVQKLCVGAPYGSFVRREIRLETNSPDQPQFVVPITGWLDINNTPRDYNQYVFKGSPRWQGIWSTPNVAGAELTGLALILIGIIGWLCNRTKEPHSFFAVVGFVTAISLLCQVLVWLGQTYSREAWVALFITSVVVAFCCPPLRRVALGVMVSFSIVLLLMPHGMQRFESYADLTGDLSISNRLKLWEGALQIMAEHPLSGVGSGEFEIAFERDYQGFNHTAKTATAVNDFLTFGAEHGIFSLSAIIGLTSLLVTSALRLVCKTHNIFLMTLTAVLIGSLITSSFSTLWVIPDYQLLVGISLFGLAWYGVVTVKRDTEKLELSKRLLLRLSGFSALTLVILFIVAITSLLLLPTRIVSHQIYDGEVETASFQAVGPRWHASHGIIIYLTSIADPTVLYHSTIRPLAAMGWQVIPLADTTDLAKVRYLIQALLRLTPQANIFIAGDAEGGKSAWKIAAEESPSNIKAGCGYDFLTMDLVTDQSPFAPHQPFLVYQSLYAEGTSSNPAIRAQRQVALNRLSLTVILSSDWGNHFSPAWMSFLATLNTFFLNENNRT